MRLIHGADLEAEGALTLTLTLTLIHGADLEAEGALLRYY